MAGIGQPGLGGTNVPAFWGRFRDVLGTSGVLRLDHAAHHNRSMRRFGLSCCWHGLRQVAFRRPSGCLRRHLHFCRCQPAPECCRQDMCHRKTRVQRSLCAPSLAIGGVRFFLAGSQRGVAQTALFAVSQVANLRWRGVERTLQVSGRLLCYLRLCRLATCDTADRAVCATPVTDRKNRTDIGASG